MSLQCFDAVAVFTACETDVFTHEAKCTILDFMPDKVSSCYWEAYYEEYDSDSAMSDPGDGDVDTNSEMDSDSTSDDNM